MSTNGAFILPAGVSLVLENGALSISNPGDIVIEGAPAQPLHRLESTGGNVVLKPPKAMSLESIVALSGTVTVSGKVKANSITARAVEMGGGTLKVGVIKASESILLAGRKLEANIVVAPHVEIDSGLKGRATAIQSDNELGPHSLKGGFSLAEFCELVPNGAEILAEHGIDVPESADEEDEDEDEDPSRSPGGPPEDAVPSRSAAADEPAQAAKKERAARPEPVVEPAASAPAPSDPDGDVVGQITDALGKITASYDQGELPPPVAQLRDLVDAGDYKQVKSRINGIWSELLKYTQQTDGYIPNTVTHMFQTIQILLRKVTA